MYVGIYVGMYLCISTCSSTLYFDFVFDFVFRLCVLTFCFERLDFKFRPTRLYASTLSSTIGPSRLWIFGQTLTCARPATIET